MTSGSKKTRYGIGEYYGRDYSTLSPPEIRELANASFKSQKCPFRNGETSCHKQGGVCSLRLYSDKDGRIASADEKFVATCPTRFYDSGKGLAWVGEVLLGTSNPIVLTELPFLKAAEQNARGGFATVGKIDMVLVHPDLDPLNWCALEIQAVYFSGPSMASEFNLMKTWEGPGVPFPQKIRRPDFRSSGPKRLMPQLQIKVPTISRWGKKTAVVVDRSFWDSLGTMSEVESISNCDIAWFVMDYENVGGRYSIVPHKLHLTTLERAVEGLTGGHPTRQQDFEDALMTKLGYI